jgi:hypothetical protein
MRKSALEFGHDSWFLLYLGGGEEGEKMGRELYLAYLSPSFTCS